MGYFPVRYDSRVVIYERKMFIRLSTDYESSLPSYEYSTHIVASLPTQFLVRIVITDDWCLVLGTFTYGVNISIIFNRSFNLACPYFKPTKVLIEGRSPGVVAKGGDSYSAGRGFESQHCILDGYFFTYICCKIVGNVCL